MILTLFPVPTRASVYEGDCGADGDNVQWAFDDETGVLTITGSGAMADYPSEYNTPWTDYHSYSITSVQIGEGVTKVGSYAFYYCYNLADVSLPSTLTSVGDYAFSGCSSLSSVTLPDSLESIGYSAFNSCESLTSVTLSKGLESIGDSAFFCCNSLTSVTIPASVKSLGNYAFQSCPYLSSVTLSEGVESIGDSAFYECYNLSSLTIPKSVTEIGSNAFPGSLTPTVYFDSYAWRHCMSNNISCNVLDGDGKNYVAAGECGADGAAVHWKLDADGALTVYGSGAMADFDSGYSGPWRDWRDNVKTVDIQSGVTSVCSGAFYGSYGYNYPNLTALSLPNDLASIGNCAFQNADALTSVTIPASVTNVGSGAFADCENLILTVTENSPAHAYAVRETIPFKLAGGGDTVYRYVASGECGADGDNLRWALDADGLLTVYGSGDMREGDSWTGGPWFDWRDSVKTVEIQSGVTSVGAYAFYGDSYPYPNLTALSIPDTVTSIGNYAFQNADALTSVTIPASVTNVGDGAFRDCDSLTLTVTDQTPGYGYALRENIPFKLAGGGDTVYSHTAGGDCGADGASVYWTLDGDALTIFGNGAMRDCDSEYKVPWYNWRDSIKTVDIHSGVTFIGYCAFQDCNALTSVTIPDSVASIGDRVFWNCDALTSVTLPDSLTSIGSNAFYDCDALTSIVIPDNVTAIGNYAFDSCDALSSVKFPANLVSIGEHTFGNCYKLSSVTFPDKLVSIGDYAFWCCQALITISLPNSVTSVGDYAFQSCDALASLTLSANLASIGEGAFQACNALRRLTIPDKVSIIGKEAFRGCGRLTALTIPATVKTVGEGAFRSCGDLLLTVTKDSGGHAYALSDGVPFKLADETSGPVRVGGSCGANVSWLLDWNSGVLEINGSGDMVSCPWSSYSDKIKTVNIGSGVTSVCDYAFQSCYSLASVTLPNGLTSIGYQAFYGCNNLASVNIPDSVSSVGSYAFQDCDALTSVTLPGKLDKIEAYAFYDCDALETVAIANGPLSIDREAFYSCNALASVTIPASIVSIDDSAFSDCPNVVLTVTEGSEGYNYADRNNVSYRFVGDNTTYRRGSCGADAGNPVLWVLDDAGLLTISGSGSMRDFDSEWDVPWYNLREQIKLVSVDSGVTSVGEYAFAYCYALESAIIPASVTAIGDYAFLGYAAPLLGPVLTVTEDSDAHQYALRQNMWFRFVGEAETTRRLENTIWDFSEDGALSVSGSGAMRDFNEYDMLPRRDALQTASIASGVTSVGAYAFRDCDALTSVTLPDGATSIGAYAFYSCDALASAAVPASVTEIADDAFNDCPNLILTVTQGSAAQDYAISHSILYRLAGSDTVYDGKCGDDANWSLNDDGLLKISGSGAMSDWDYYGSVPWSSRPYSVQRVEIENGIASIGSFAFYNCKNLTSVTIPDSVTSIGTQAFYGCDALSSLTLPGNVTEISGDAFTECGNLVVTAPDNSATRQAVSKAGVPHKLPGSETVYLAFGLWGTGNGQTWNLESSGVLTVSGNGAISAYANSSAAPWASVRDSVRTLIVQEGVTQIGSYAFADCGSLEKAFLPNSLTTLGGHVFENDRNLTFVSLEEGVTSIGASAFYNCMRLLDLTIPASATSIGESAFNSDWDYGGKSGEYTNAPIEIIVYDGSPAMTYAETYGIPHTVMTRGTAKVSGVTLDQNSLTLTVGDTVFLTASVQPDDAENKKVVWSSDNPAVASVDERGIVTTLSEGAATITVTTDDGGLTASCAVTVLLQIPASAIVLSASRQALAVGGAFNLTATVFPENASDKTVTWSTSDDKIASVYVYDDYYGYDANTVRVKKEAEGTATVTARSADGSVTAECEIMDYLEVQGVRIDQKSVVLKQGGEDRLSATVLPQGASNGNVSWSSSNEYIATVSEDGTVTGREQGKATIIAKTEENGFTAFCLVEVTDEVTRVEGVTLNRTEIPSMEFGASMPLVASITPENATNQAITWTSSAPEAVAVSDNGVVTALAMGKTARITAMTADGGKTASCVVTVSDLTAPTALEVYAPPELTAVEGSPLNLDGVIVTAIYGEIRESVTDYTVTDYNRNHVGKQHVTVTYREKSAEFVVTVKDRHPEEALIAQSPYQREYALGESLDLTGLILQVRYNDQTLETVQYAPGADITAVGFRSDKAGAYPVTVTWAGLSVAFYVTILAESNETVSLSAPKMNIVGYPGGKRVELSAAPGAEIRYEFNDRVPGFDSTLYQEPILCATPGTTVIKAAAFLNGEMSAVTVSRVFVSQTEPLVASYDDGAQLPAGTLVTLQTPTVGADIRYTTDGSEPTTDSPRYSTGVLVNASMTLKAIAMMDGAISSETLEASYTVEDRTDAQSAATISLGSVTSRAGDRASVPVYLFTDGDENVTFFRFTMTFDKRAFEFASVSPAEGISVKNLTVSSGANSGSVTVMYAADEGSAMESGEAFSLTLRALDSAEDGDYDLKLSDEDGITVKAGNVMPLVNPTPGVIALRGSHNSQLTGTITLRDSEGNAVDQLPDAPEKISVNFDLDPYASLNGNALTTCADVYCVLYDKDNLMLDLQTHPFELKNVGLAFSFEKDIDPAIQSKVAKVKFIILSEDMQPLGTL